MTVQLWGNDCLWILTQLDLEELWRIYANNIQIIFLNQLHNLHKALTMPVFELAVLLLLSPPTVAVHVYIPLVCGGKGLMVSVLVYVCPDPLAGVVVYCCPNIIS